MASSFTSLLKSALASPSGSKVRPFANLQFTWSIATRLHPLPSPCVLGAWACWLICWWACQDCGMCYIAICDIIYTSVGTYFLAHTMANIFWSIFLISYGIVYGYRKALHLLGVESWQWTSQMLHVESVWPQLG